jgi:hypothetical protein
MEANERSSSARTFFLVPKHFGPLSSHSCPKRKFQSMTLDWLFADRNSGMGSIASRLCSLGKDRTCLGWWH